MKIEKCIYLYMLASIYRCTILTAQYIVNYIKMLYKYCTIGGFDILLNSRLKAARIEDFNDPFELVFGVNKDNALDTIKKEYEDDENIIKLWQDLLEGQKIEYKRKSVEDVIEKVARFQVEDFRRVVKILRQSWNEKLGIVCMSESPDIIQMWAHYTDNHNGIVIGLDENQFVKDKLALVKVEYNDQMILLPISAHPDKFKKYADYFRDILRRKENNWAYEQEIRLYANLDEKNPDGNYYVDIPPTSIKELYIGLRSQETTKIIAESIKRKEEYRHLKIYKMDKDERTYKLRPKEI